MRDFFRRHSRAFLFGGLVLGSAAGAVLPEGWSGRVRGGLGAPFAPLETGLTAGGALVSDLVRPLVTNWRRGRDLEALQAEVARLEREKAQLRARLAERERDVSDALALRRALPSERLEFVVAPVIARDASAWSHTVTLGKGWRSGVRQGQTALTATERLVAAGAGDGLEPGDAALDGACLVGRVIAVGPFHSVVRLVTDADSVMRAEVVGERDGRAVQVSAGILRGSVEGQARLKIEFIRSRDDVRPGDVVLTAGYGGALPAPLVVGRVASVQASPMPLLSDVAVTPESSLDTLGRVIVVRQRPRT
jgi:rod shape-determining protein MreC